MCLCDSVCVCVIYVNVRNCVDTGKIAHYITYSSMSTGGWRTTVEDVLLTDTTLRVTLGFRVPGWREPVRGSCDSQVIRIILALETHGPTNQWHSRKALGAVVNCFTGGLNS